MNAYEISGKIGLDNTPAIHAFEESVKAAVDFKTKVEKSSPQLNIDAARALDAQKVVTDRFRDIENVAAKAGETAGKNWAERFAGKAKSIMMDDRAAGEMALARFMGQGARGFLDMGLSMAGIGAGTMAIEGTAKAINETFDAVRNWKEIAHQVGKAGGNMADFSMEAGKTLPVLGQVVGLGERINDLWTGNRSSVEQVHDETDKLVRLMEAGRNAAKGWRDQFEEMGAGLKDLTAQRDALKALADGKPGEAAAITNAVTSDKAIEAARGKFQGQTDARFSEYFTRTQAATAAGVDPAQLAGITADYLANQTKATLEFNKQVATIREIRDINNEISRKGSPFEVITRSLESQIKALDMGPGGRAVAALPAGATEAEKNKVWALAESLDYAQNRAREFGAGMSAIDDLQRRISEHGKSGVDLERERLTAMAGVTPEQMKQFDKLADQWKSIAAADDMKKIEDQFSEKSRFDRAREDISANKMLNDDQRRTALGLVNQAESKAEKMVNTPPPSLIMSGTAEAFAAKFANDPKPEAEQLKNQEKQINIAEAANKLLDRMVQAITNLGVSNLSGA